jgi:hypothetical protein
MFLARTAGILAISGCALLGQEGEIADFNPRDASELTLTELLIGLLFVLACGCAWKLLMWLLESRRSTINWIKLRIWWPTGMLVWGLVLLAMSARNASLGWALDAVLFVFALLNFPALVVVGMLFALERQIIEPAGWVQFFLGSLAMWSANYLLVRLAEWRAWMNVPVSLHLSDSTSRERSPPVDE